MLLNANKNSDVKISAIIPVKNGGQTLEKCLISIRQQTIPNVEIIILDSMSTDCSKVLARQYGAKIIDIPNGQFNHGLTRNIGVQHASGELIYFTVQDAYLTENNQLETMADHFINDEITSVTGIQGIPADIDKNPALWFKRFSQPVSELRYFTREAFETLSPEFKLENCRWDNVNAMYRRSALKSLPFQKTDFAEDALWARDALLRGWKIIRDSSLVVYHYHHQTFTYSFKSSFIVNYYFWKQFKVWPAFPSLVVPFTRNVYTLIKRKELSFLSKIKWMLHNFFRLSGNYLSVLLFRSVYLLGKEKLLNKSYHLLCSKVPQGLQNKNNKSVILKHRAVF